MRARTSIIVLLLVSLFLATQVHPLARPVEMTKGPCAGMQCAQRCCANMVCCTVSQQQQSPQPQTPATPRLDLQLATIGLRTFSLLYPLPPIERSFASRNETHALHSRPTLAVTCIRLI